MTLATETVLAEPGFVMAEELALLRDTVRDFIRREVLPAEREIDPDATELPPAVLGPIQARARAAGLWCFGAPVAYGGGGLGIFAQSVVAEETAQCRLGGYNYAAGAFGYDPPLIIWDGTPEQIERYGRPTLARGGRAFIAITEPGGGSDPARTIKTTAVRDGDGWRLNGSKVYITGFAEASWGIVFARTGQGRGGITAFIVETDWPGVSSRPMPVIRPWVPYEVIFEDCFVPAENQLGPEGEGFAFAQKWLTKTRVTYAAGVVGTAVAAHRMMIEYAKQREIWGSPLADKQAIQWMIADSEVEIRAARWLVWDAAWKADRGQSFRYEASIAKLYATEMATRVVDRAIQIHGGLGVSKALPLERWYRELRIKRIGEGPSEVHRMVIARELTRGARA